MASTNDLINRYFKQYAQGIQVVDRWHTKSIQPVIHTLYASKIEILLDIFDGKILIIHEFAKI